MTLPERLLWRELRKRPAGLRFRKQHPAGPYVLDFLCLAKRLTVEVDGEAHGRGDQPGRDAARDAGIASNDVRTLRVPACDMLANLEGVVRLIVATAAPGGDYPSTSFAGPPPPPGEV